MIQRNPIRLLLLSMLMHFVVLAPPAALAREIRVDDNCSLHDAITAYNTETSTGGCHMPTWGKPRIYLKTDIKLTEPLPAIVTDLTIDGWGHQISGDKLHQVFVVYNHELTINNLHIVDGFSDEHGGAIYVHGGEVTLTNSSIKNSLALESGGAIYAHYSTVSISESVITRNTAEAGGGVYLYESSLDLLQSAISFNVATNSGAIWGFRADMSIIDSEIFHNHARQAGGGIGAAEGTLKIRHSKLAENSAIGIGGALNIWHIKTTLYDVTLSNNSSTSDGGAIALNVNFLMVPIGFLSIENSSIVENRAVERGGAMFAHRGDVLISNSTFNNNKAGGNGGALYLENRDSTLTHVTIAQNAAFNGGGVYLREPDIMQLRNSLLAGNKGGDCVGGLAGNKGNWIADDSCEPRYSGDPQLNPVAGSPLYFPLRRESLAINRAHQDYCLDADQQGTPRPQGDACDIGAYEAVEWIEGEYDYHIRGTITSPDIIVNNECSLADAITSANRDEATGGCIAGVGADTIRLSADLRLEDAVANVTNMYTPDKPLPDITSEIVIEGENRLLDADGNIVFSIKFGDLTINNLRLTNAASNVFRDFDGGAIILRYGRLQINNSKFTSNWALNGAVIYSVDSDIVINDSVLANNMAGEKGGALYIYDGSVNITNSIISGNEATDGGGAIFGPSSPSIRITESVINDNRTEGEGGGMLVYGHVDLIDTSLLRNEAAKGGALAGRAYSSFDLENVDFVDNVAEDCPREYNEIERRCR